MLWRCVCCPVQYYCTGRCAFTGTGNYKWTLSTCNSTGMYQYQCASMDCNQDCWLSAHFLLDTCMDDPIAGDYRQFSCGSMPKAFKGAPLTMYYNNNSQSKKCSGGPWTDNYVLPNVCVPFDKWFSGRFSCNATTIKAVWYDGKGCARFDYMHDVPVGCTDNSLNSCGHV